MTTRDLSSALFGNEKMAELVMAVLAEKSHTTAQQVANRLGINHDLARKPLLRLVDAGVLVALPKEGGRRSTQFYEVVPGARWSALVALCAELTGGPVPEPAGSTEAAPPTRPPRRLG